MAKALVIYHANCDDGFGAAFAFWKYKAPQYENVAYHPGVYGDNPPFVDKDTDIYILDFSYDPETLCILAGEANTVVLLDHHKTAMEAWDKFREANDYPSNLFIEFDMNRSGAMLAYNYFKTDNSCNCLFDFLQDRDLWRFEFKDTKAFTQYLRTLPQDFAHWNTLNNRLNGSIGYANVIETGEVLLNQFEKLYKEICGMGKREIWIDGIKGLECNCPPQFASEIGDLLAKESGTFGHTWFVKDDYNLHSLRSLGEFDVSVIAKSLGGGGHKNAAGFKLPFSSSEYSRFQLDAPQIW